jgi:signal transduction histidine kinase
MNRQAASDPAEVEKLRRRLVRERRIRDEAEQISERVTTELYERQRELELLEAVAQQWNAAGTIDEAIQIAIDRICEHTGWPVGHAYLDEEDAVLRSARVWHLDDPEGFAEFRRVSEERALTSGEGLPGRILASGEPAWIVDVLEDPNFPRARDTADIGVRAAFGFPILVADGVVGVLEFFASTPLEPDKSLLRSVTQIGTQLGQFVERKRASEEADRVKAEFFALVSHELRTPLTSIRGYLDLVLEQEAEALGETGQRFLEVIARNAKRLEDLVADLLLVTQVEAGSFKVHIGTVDLTALAGEAVEAARPKAAELKIELSIDHDDLPDCPGDAARLGQALDNVISNAIKFTPEGGTVDVRVSNSGGRAMVEVHDTGPGIPEDEMARLFERFYRAKGARAGHVQGVGLGLAITEAIVEAHDGTIGVTSEVGKGTTFRIELPLGEASAKASR